MKTVKQQVSRPRIMALLMIFTVSMMINTAVGLIIKVPGYMDAEYYYLGAKNISMGHGFSEMVLWNYLDDPEGIPHPSHSYWMPLTSIIASMGLFIFQNQKFIFAQIPFIILSALIPILTYYIAKNLYASHKLAILASIFSLFSGYLLVYQTTTSTITPYIILGGLYILVFQSRYSATKSRRWYLISIFVLGGISGLMHLTRADGILWLLGVIFVVLIDKGISLRSEWKSKSIYQIRQSIPIILLGLAGYLFVMLPWFLRNISLTGSPLPPGGFLTFWLTGYNQTFIYPASLLDPQQWWAFGLGNHFIIRLKALFSNLLTAVGVSGEILLTPLAVCGFIGIRRKHTYGALVLIWLLNLILMSIVFPFAGMRGGFLHASASFQTLIWVLTPAGLEAFIRWGGRSRNWNRDNAYRVFASSFIAMLFLFTIFIFYSKVIGDTPGELLWQRGWNRYEKIEERIESDFPEKSDVVIINNPPGYFIASSGRSAIVLPDGDEATLRMVARRYGAKIVAVDRNIVSGLMALFQHPELYQSGWLQYLYTVEDTHIFAVIDDAIQ